MESTFPLLRRPEIFFVLLPFLTDETAPLEMSSLSAGLALQGPLYETAIGSRLLLIHRR